MASPEAQEEDKSGEGPPGEEEKMSQDAVEVVVVGADGEKEAAGVDVTGGEGKRKRGRKPKGAPGAPKSEAAGKKVGKKRSSGVARPAVVRLRPTRDRKTVERFSVTSPQRGVATKAVSIQQGSGTKLKDIPNVVFKLSKRRADENLQFLHKILFAKKAKALYLKRNIYQFSGFVWTENKEKHRAKVKEKLDKCVKDKLLDFCDLLDIPVLRATTKKEEMSTKLLEFLESPHVTRDTVLAEKEQKSRKRKRSKGITESTDADADADRETKGKKRKEGNEASAIKKMHKDSVTIMEEEEIGDSSDENRHEGGMKGSDDETSETEEDEQERVADQKVSTPKQKSKAQKSNVNAETIIKKRGRPAKSAKGPSASSSKRSPSEGKGKAAGKSSKGSSIEQSKRGSKAPTNQGDEPSKKISVKFDKNLLDSRKSAQIGKSDTGIYYVSKSKREKSKSKNNEALTEDKDKEKSQPGPTVSAKKQGKGRGSGKPDPTREELHAAVRDILKEVDFNTATFADILRQLGSQFGTDLMHRKAEVKSIIEEVINDMTDDEEDGGKDGDEDDAEEEHKDVDA